MNTPHPWYRTAQTAGPEPLPGSRVDARSDRHRNAFERFLGGPPLAVVVRLLIVSFLVGILLMWFDIRPFDVFDALRRFANRIWFLGWDSVRAVLDYVIAGALLVLPCWLILRLMNFRGR